MLPSEFYLYRPIAIKPPISANKVGAIFAPTLYLPVMPVTLALLKGMLQYAEEAICYTGTETEIENALEVVRSQLAARAMTQEEICGAQPFGATFRALTDLLEGMQGEGLPPPPWEFRIDIRQGDYWLQFRTQEETP